MNISKSSSEIHVDVRERQNLGASLAELFAYSRIVRAFPPWKHCKALTGALWYI